jgi:hypothetical protein
MARVVILPYNCPGSIRTLTSSSKQPRNAWRARLKFFHPDRQVSLKQTPEGINRG